MSDLDFSIDMTEFMKAIKKLEDQAQPALEQAAEAGILVAHSWILEEMAKGKTGKTYLVNKGRQRHVASAPGEAPAMETGSLANSLIPEPLESGPDYAIHSLKVGQDYGIHLEFGTKNMAPRPYIRISFEKNRTQITEAIRSVLARWLS